MKSLWSKRAGLAEKMQAERCGTKKRALWNWREERVTQGAVSSLLCRPELAANLSWPKLLKALTLSLQICVLVTENDIVCSSQREPGAMLQAVRDKQMLLPEERLDCLLLQRAWGTGNYWKHAWGEPKQEKVTLPGVLFTGVCALTIFPLMSPALGWPCQNRFWDATVNK